MVSFVAWDDALAVLGDEGQYPIDEVSEAGSGVISNRNWAARYLRILVQ